MNYNARLAKLEAQHAPPQRLVIRYEDQTDPAELEALRNDPAVNLILIKYVEAEHEEPTD